MGSQFINTLYVFVRKVNNSYLELQLFYEEFG